MRTLLSCVYGLLLNPEKHDPLDSTLALSANNDSGEYEAVSSAPCCRCHDRVQLTFDVRGRSTVDHAARTNSC